MGGTNRLDTPDEVIHLLSRCHASGGADAPFSDLAECLGRSVTLGDIADMEQHVLQKRHAR